MSYIPQLVISFYNSQVNQICNQSYDSIRALYSA